jgi:hypothetical protein
MESLLLLELVVFSVLAISTLFAGMYSAALALEIFKNRKKVSLFSAFFLNQNEAKRVFHMYFVAAVPLFLTGIFTFLQKSVHYFISATGIYSVLDNAFFFLAYFFGISGALILSIVIIKSSKVLHTYIKK